MAITHRAFVLITFPLCCASVALLVTALATRSWFQATSYFKNNLPPGINDINYGLFVGTYVKQVTESPQTYDIFMTCLGDEGICAWSCLDTVELREAQVRELLESGTNLYQCTAVRRDAKQQSQWFHYSREHLKSQSPDHNLNSIAFYEFRNETFPVDKKFISLGLWASTIAFLSIAILLAAIGAAFAVVNTAGNPVEPILGILGLFIWNASAAVSIIITLIIWGTQFSITLLYNAVLPDTISGETSSNGRGALGYSYWLIFVAGLLHLLNIGLLFYRRHLILTEPPAPTIRMEEDPDGAIFLY